jgi:hypothetical protein
MLFCCNQLKSSPAHLDTAYNYLNVRETSNNSSKEIDMFLKSVGLGKGYSWCSAFISYCLTQAKVYMPKMRSALARAFISKKAIKANDVLQGRVKIPKGSIVIWRKGNTLNGHIGFVTKDFTGRNLETIEGNTSSGGAGSQNDGDGVYLRKRQIQPHAYFRITNFEIVK